MGTEDSVYLTEEECYQPEESKKFGSPKSK